MKKRRTRGFTLPELIVGLTVAATLAAMAVPSLRDMSLATRVGATHNELTGALAFARAQAVRHAQPVGVCASDDQRSCSAGGDWSRGWISFTDASGRPGVADGDDQLLRAWPALADGVVVRSDALDRGTWVRFDAAGRLLPMRSERHFSIAPADCRDGTAPAMNLTLGPSGSIDHERTTCH